MKFLTSIEIEHRACLCLSEMSIGLDHCWGFWGFSVLSVLFIENLGFWGFSVWGFSVSSVLFIENLGFVDSGQILEMYVVLLYFPFKNAVISLA